MTRNLLVTIADENYLEPARQLFACVHFDAGWSGDLMLLAHDVPEEKLVPFRERGIRVRPVGAWHREHPSVYHPTPVLSKFYLFTPEFREWDRVLYLDGDMMFWSSLDRLARVKGLAAISDRTDLAWQFRKRSEQTEDLYRDLSRRYDLRQEAFNTGLLAYSTDVIREDTLAELQSLYLRFEKLQASADQGVLNLYFYRRWRRVPDFYAALRHVPARFFFVPKYELRTIGRHFVGRPRVWDPANPWHAEWKRSLARFEDVDARKPKPPRHVWSGFEIRRYYASLWARRLFFLAFGPLLPAAERLRKSRPVKLVRNLLRRLRVV
jgi:hypothetical protein